VDYSYKINRANLLPFSSASQNWGFDIVSEGNGPEDEATSMRAEVIRQTVIQNKIGTIAGIVGGGVLLAFVLSLAIILVTKKKGGA
jgi:hypothetical protein